MSKSQELRENKIKLVTEARKLNDLIKSENREYTAEESEQFDRIMADVANLDNEIKSVEAAEKRSEFLSNSDSWMQQPKSQAIVPEIKNADVRNEFHRAAITKYLRHGLQALTATEYRAVSTTDSAGGYLMPDNMFNSNLIQTLNNSVFVRTYARKFTLSGTDTLVFPRKKSAMSAPTWTTEVAGPNEDSTLELEQVSLFPNQLSKLIKVSMKSLLCSSFDILGFLNEEFAYQFGVTLENGYLNGRGKTTYNEPVGIFEESATGAIPNTRNVSTGNTITTIKADGLQAAKFAMQPQYRSGARWIFHNDAIAQIAKMKDGEGRYLWQQSLAAGTPDTLLGLPVDVSAYCPNTFTTGETVGALVNWNQGYYIADLQALELQRLQELYAGTSQVGIIGRMYTDGKPVDDNAFVRVELA